MDDGTGGAALNFAIVVGTLILAAILVFGMTHYRKRGRGPTAPRSGEHPDTGARVISATDVSQNSRQ